MNRVALVIQYDRGEANEVYIFEGPERGPLWDEARSARDRIYNTLDYFDYFDATILNVSETLDIA